MAKERFISWDPPQATAAILGQAEEVVRDYMAQGYDLTLRQLYYQLVAKAIIPNTERSYKNLGNWISKARLAGIIDWSAIVDRTRNLKGLSTWDSPAEILDSCVYSFRTDVWADQPWAVEVWVEKEALAGVVGRAATKMRVDYFCCRGYVSQSEQYDAAKRLRRYRDAGRSPLVLHLGDHDPSGVDMTRDNYDRLTQFARTLGIKVKRIALNMDQIEELNPPPNPAKLTDSRAGEYVRRFGYDSWELDALPPNYINDLIERHVLAVRDEEAWAGALAREEEMKNYIRKVRDDYRAQEEDARD